MSIRTVLVASDPSPTSDRVVEAGARLAAAREAELHLVTARAEPAAPAILARAHELDADLLVLGRPRSRFGAVNRILCAATTPVLVTDAPLAEPPGPVLVGVDVLTDTAGSLANTLGWVRSLFPRELDEPIRVTTVHVVPELPDALEALGWNDTEATATTLAVLTRGAVERLDSDEVEARSEVRSAPTVVDGLVRCAEELGAGLAVVSARPRSALRQLLLGGATCALVRRAPCAVLAAPVARAPRPPEAMAEEGCAGAAAAP